MRAGVVTRFKEHVLDGTKHHAVLPNFDIWNRRMKEIEAGEAALEIAEYARSPISSVPFLRLTIEDGIGLQLIKFRSDGMVYEIDGMHSAGFNDLVPDNEGLPALYFRNWILHSEKLYEPFEIVHFGKFRYKGCKEDYRNSKFHKNYKNRELTDVQQTTKHNGD